MQLNKGKLSQLKTAFKSVYGVPSVDEQDLVRYGSEILFYADKFPFESDELMSQRFTTINDLSDSDAIIDYLSHVPDSEFDGCKQTSTYGRLFHLGQLHKVGYAGESKIAEPKEAVKDIPAGPKPAESHKSEPVKPVVSYSDPANVGSAGYKPGMEQSAASDEKHGTNPAAPVSPIVEDTEAIKNLTYHKEEKSMSNPVEMLAHEAGQTGIGTGVGTNVAEISKNDRAAAAKVVEATQMDRRSYSNNAKITKVLITAIDREKKAVEGRAAMGYVSNPKKAFETFISKTGCTVEDGTVKFSKLHSTETHDNARKMYELLVRAENDNKTQVVPYFGKDGAAVPVSVKGIVIDDPAHKEMIVAQKDIAAHILQNAFLYLNVDSGSGAQFQLDTAGPRAGSVPKKSYVVKVANKAEMLQDDAVCVYVKNLTAKVSESKTGFKSALTISVNSNKPDANGQPKKLSWRIPLDVEQYDVEIVDQYSDLFKSGVGNTVKPVSATTEADVTNIVEKITKLLAAESSKGTKDSILGTTLIAELNEQKGMIVAEDAAGVNAVLGQGATSDSSEFEG